MDRGTLSTLRSMIRPLAPAGTLTMERAAAVASLNFEVARFHADVAQAERLLAITGIVDEPHQKELIARALHLGKQREALMGTHGTPGDAPGAGAAAAALPSAGALAAMGA